MAGEGANSGETCVNFLPRRELLRKSAIAVLATLGPIGSLVSGSAAAAAVTDTDLFNFILQLKYLEAEYAVRGVTGSGLPSSLTSGTGQAGGVNGGTLVPFVNPAIFEIAADIYTNDVTQLGYLRTVLGNAVTARPLIDIAGGFQFQAQEARITTTAQFNPFAGEVNFLLGAFLLKEVTVTALAGLVALLSNPANVSAVAGILGVAGYHAGAVRALLTQIASGNAMTADQPGAPALPFQTEAIADLQSQIVGFISGVGIINPVTGAYQISARDGSALAYRRTPAQVLNVVTSGFPASAFAFDPVDESTAVIYNVGGFFPQGVNGTIHSQATAP